jgi:hypothetical protein
LNKVNKDLGNKNGRRKIFSTKMAVQKYSQQKWKNGSRKIFATKMSVKNICYKYGCKKCMEKYGCERYR